MAENLKELFDESMRGAPEAEDRFYVALVDRTLQLLHWHARRRRITREDVIQDIGQEVLLRFVRNVRERRDWVKLIENWDAVLSRTIGWCINDYFRGLGPDQAPYIEPMEEGRAAEDDGLYTAHEYLVWVQESNILKSLEERWAIIDGCMAAIGASPLTMEVVRLRLTGHTFEEIADKTGLSVNAATLRYHSFCKSFRAWLKQRAGGGGSFL